jgi:peptide/nickel transport system substrate-binding protein
MAASGSTVSRLPLLVAALALVAAMAAGTVVYMRVSGEETVVIPQTTRYTEGVAGTWQRVNPLFAAANDVDQDLAQLVFSGLVRIGPEGDVLPDLAASLPEISEGGRTYTFRLRDDVRWHDGEPFTSADVLSTIQALREPGFRGDSSVSALWADVALTAPDDYTVVARLPEPSAPFLARAATIGILPEHLLGQLGPVQLFESPFNVSPVGTGPYRLAGLTATEARLEAYPAYHLGRPAIGELRLRFYTDYTDALAALANGDIEGIMIRSPLSESQRASIDEIQGLEVLQPQRAAHLVLYLNNDAAAFFQDERVRKAIALAIDREAIVGELYGGDATASSSPIAPGSWAYTSDYEVPPVDALDAARELLDEAGWQPHPTTGTRIRLGSEFRITIRTDTDPLRVAVAQMIASQLEPLGIRATVASTSFAVLRRDFLQERRYEAAVAGWDQGSDPDPYFGWHSSQMGSAGLNIANYSNPIADRLIEEGRRSSNPEVRQDMYYQFQEIWDRSAPSVIIAYPRYTYVHVNRIQSVVPELLPAPHLRFAFIHEWRRS